MAPPAWLPPLNSHQDSCIHVRIREYNVRRFHGVFFNLAVYVDFYSENDQDMELSIPGFARVYGRRVDLNDPGQLKGFLWELILDEDLIPFPLRGCFWSEKQLHGSPTPRLQLPDEVELVGRIFDFLRLVHEKPVNDDKMVVASLEIRKDVRVPAEEFASWLSWRDGQRRIYPEFDSRYSLAITRPRDRSEVYREAESLMARRPAKIVNGELEIVVVNGGKDEDGGGEGSSVSGEEPCSICLEGFSDGGLGTRLPCNHVFHENCILRWLRGNHVCPLCRYQLPVEE
ncbi:putative E3 ubiquitin-protein ligase RHC2A [Sesamum alatum]|uniref:RING-type E3 ubiquitin transferase n=1 Tax=Sesamum alatum TaxID=300844 RepID=A0AAE2CPH8_9LAMI|nr:putative E3 ubiquitin-protein ligase RHC2A [Sesamum alatum]